jgi:hypothetical protein
MRVICETVYKQVNHKWDQYNLVPNLNETVVKHESLWNLDAPKD